MSDPRIWGTDQWKAMHRFSLAYPKRNPTTKHRRAARQYFESLQYLLPCVGCRAHYAKHFRDTFRSSTTDNRMALARWVYDLHEAVNKRLGKPAGVVRFEDLPALYNTFPSRYVAADGKALLEEPRFSTLQNDYAGAELNIEYDAAVAKAVQTHNALQESPNGKEEEDHSISATTMLCIGLIAALLLSIVATLVYIYVVQVRAAKKQQLTDTTVVQQGSNAA